VHGLCSAIVTICRGGGLLQAAIDACDAAILQATGDDLIWALTLRGNEKACLNDYKVRAAAKLVP